MKEEKIIRLEEIHSTNEYVKDLRQNGEQENVVVIAKKQSGGKGTKGRSFSSLEGGVYLTKLVFYENFPAKDAFLVMARAAVAVCKTLEKFSLKPTIKWANDVYVSNRKICGILIENSFSGNRIASSIIGVGVNVNNDLPEELQEIATSMKLEKGESQDFSAVEAELLKNLSEEFTIEEYISRVGYLGKEAVLIQGEEKFTAIPVGVRTDGALEVQINGEIKVVYSGEVSLIVQGERK